MFRTYLRLAGAIFFILISLILLSWSLWPYNRITQHQLLQPTEMQVPTPEGFVPPASARVLSNTGVLFLPGNNDELL